MRLIDADRLNACIDNMLAGEYEGDPEIQLKKLIEDQPTVFPMFMGRTNGKTAFKNYVGMCKVLDEHGIDSLNPIESLEYVLQQYQRVIDYCTNGKFSKLTTDANVLIETVREYYETITKTVVLDEVAMYLDDGLKLYDTTKEAESEAAENYRCGYLRALRNAKRELCGISDNKEYESEDRSE